jgi:predicted TIM-barrel fold metal-dependent hydrolase
VQAGFDVLLSLVRAGKIYVKLSAAHRISEAPDCADAAAIAQALVAANPDRMVWGSDWPHPGAWPGTPRSTDPVEPFHPIDDGRTLNRLHEWVGDAARFRRILVDNPARLYGF